MVLVSVELVERYAIRSVYASIERIRVSFIRLVDIRDYLLRPVRIINPHEPPTDTDFNRLIPPLCGGIMLN